MSPVLHLGKPPSLQFDLPEAILATRPALPITEAAPIPGIPPATILTTTAISPQRRLVAMMRSNAQQKNVQIS